MSYTLTRIETPEDRAAYHAIRKSELFDARQRKSYDADHPDETKPGNTPLVLKDADGIVVATTRFDVRDATTGILRLVAVRKDLQGKGIGAALMSSLLAFAEHADVQRLVLNANKEAIGYYEKSGFRRESWDPAELTGISADSIQMVLDL